MSDTPRTDALLAPLRGSCAFTGPCAEHARQLERELNAAKAENESMRVAIKEAHTALLRVSECQIFYVESMDIDNYTQEDCGNAITKLQPFLK